MTTNHKTFLYDFQRLKSNKNQIRLHTKKKTAVETLF